MLEKVVQPPNINIQQSQAPPYSQYSQPGSPVTVSAPPFTINFQGSQGPQATSTPPFTFNFQATTGHQQQSQTPTTTSNPATSLSTKTSTTPVTSTTEIDIKKFILPIKNIRENPSPAPNYEEIEDKPIVMVPLSDRIFLYKLYKNSVSELEYGFLKFINIDNGECTYVPVAYNLYMFHAWLTFSDGNNTEKYNEKHYDIVRLTDFTKLTVNGMYFFVVEEFQNIEPYKYIDNSDDKTIVNPELINKIIEFETKLLGKITEYLKTLNTGETIKSGYKNSASTGDIKLENIEGKELANLLPLLKNNIDKDFYSEFVSTFHLKQTYTNTNASINTSSTNTSTNNSTNNSTNTSINNNL